MTATVITLTNRPAAVGGWTAVRREVIARADGRCALCGRPAADTAFRSWEADDLIAAHTSCVVGIGPPARVPDAA
jgi:5-methylcytosine-specific restriction endonuclease McrA